MSETVTEALEALLVRYEHELKSLQPEDFLERIQSWRSELETTATFALRAIIEPLTREIDRCVANVSIRAVASVDYNALDRVVRLTRTDLRRYVEADRGLSVREEGPSYGAAHGMAFDSVPVVERAEMHPAHARLQRGVPERTYPVWFGTDRRIFHAGPADFHEAGGWSDTLTYGTCHVHIPQSHTFGSVGSSWIKRMVRRTIFDLADDRLRVVQTRFGSSDEFTGSIGDELAHWAGKKTALVFVHGYNVSLREAIVRAAQIGFDLKIEGITAAFSWPSKGKLIPYPRDEAHIELSEQHFVEFIERLAQSPGLEEINVLAHSMGNRLLCRAMPRLVELQRQRRIPVPIGHVVLAAADLTTELFKQHAALYRQLAGRRVTNYSCAADKALFASSKVHGLGRVGLEPPIFVHDGIDTISASQLNVDLLGHGYYAAAEPLLYDIAELIHHNRPPTKRLRIQRGPLLPGLHWVLTQ